MLPAAPTAMAAVLLRSRRRTCPSASSITTSGKRSSGLTTASLRTQTKRSRGTAVRWRRERWETALRSSSSSCGTSERSAALQLSESTRTPCSSPAFTRPSCRHGANRCFCPQPLCPPKKRHCLLPSDSSNKSCRKAPLAAGGPSCGPGAAGHRRVFPCAECER